MRYRLHYASTQRPWFLTSCQPYETVGVQETSRCLCWNFTVNSTNVNTTAYKYVNTMESGKICYIKVSCYTTTCTFADKNPSFGRNPSTELHSITPQNTHHYNLKSNESFLLGYDVSRQRRKTITRPTLRRLHCFFFFATHTLFVLHSVYNLTRLEEGWTVRGSKTGRVEISRTRPYLPPDPPSLLYNRYYVISVGKAAGASR